VPANVPLSAEALVAISGVFPTEPLRATDAAAARAVPREWKAAVTAFFAAEEPSRLPPAPKIRYLATWKQLNQKQNDAAVIAYLDDPAIAMAYTARLKVAREYLRNEWRPLQVQGLYSWTLVDPSPSENERCTDLFAMVNKPGRLLEALASGSLLEGEMAAVEAVFPELWGMLGALIYGEVIRRRSVKKSWEPNYWQEVALRTLLDVPIGELSPVKPPEEDGPPETPPDLDIQVKRKREDLQTKTDRIGDASP
jgi:hypothetical protein